ncbi:MAG: TetR/AcrR family transcriptional regulator [Proteobacteria bacterium]|nr:TetR/AcrR family transcriptional regulator [Pseudomonadota bacterium]
MKTNSKKKSLNPEDWELAALEVIAHQGVGAVAVEPLAKQLGVTKGSFYWHFGNRKDLIVAALKRWREDDLKIIKQEVTGIKDPEERLKAWFRLSAEPLQTHFIYATLLADRQLDFVAKVLKEITVFRLSHLQEAYQQLGYAEKKAKQQALLAYSVYVGYLHMAKTLYGKIKENQSVEEYAEFVSTQLIRKLE